MKSIVRLLDGFSRDLETGASERPNVSRISHLSTSSSRDVILSRRDLFSHERTSATSPPLSPPLPPSSPLPTKYPRTTTDLYRAIASLSFQLTKSGFDLKRYERRTSARFRKTSAPDLHLDPYRARDDGQWEISRFAPFGCPAFERDRPSKRRIPQDFAISIHLLTRRCCLSGSGRRISKPARG